MAEDQDQQQQQDDAPPGSPDERVNVRNEFGGTVSVPRRTLDAVSTLREETPGEEADRLRRERLVREHDTAGSRARAALGGAADALSLGFVDPWRDDREFHPAYSGVGKVAGVAATLLVPGAGEASLGRVGLEGGLAAADAARAGEALTEAAGLGRAVRGAESVGEIARGSRLARAVGTAAERTPLGQVNRLARAAGELVPEGGVASRILRTGVEGAAAGGAIGLGTELSHQLLDSDADFSGEALLGSTLEGMAGGAAIGAGGSALSEGIGALRGLAGRVRGGAARAESGLGAEEFAARAERRAPTPYREELDVTPGGRPPLAPMLDPRNATLVDAVGARARDLKALSGRLDELAETPVLAERAGLTRSYIQEAQGTVSRELAGIRSLSRFEDAPVARLAEDAHANDLVGARLSRVTDRLPPRWGDADLRAQASIARDRALDELAAKRVRGLPVSQAEEDAVRYSAQLSVGRAPSEAADVHGSLLANVARSVVRHLPGGRLVAAGLGGAGAVGIAEHLISHGVSHVVGATALPAAAALGGAALVRAAFSDPHVGGLIAASVANVLNSTAPTKGSAPEGTSDPRRSLRALADRARTVAPQQVYAATAARLSPVAGQSPLAVQAAARAAAGRHATLLDLLDRVDPRATTPGQAALGRPLPSEGAARRVADFVRAAGSPANFMVAAAMGRLTPGLMADSEGLWPASVRRARAELTAALTSHGRELSEANRRTAEVILGRGGLGQAPRSEAYAAAMRASSARTHAPVPSGGPHPGATRVTPPEPTPAQRAANPGASR